MTAVARAVQVPFTPAYSCHAMCRQSRATPTSATTARVGSNSRCSRTRGCCKRRWRSTWRSTDRSLPALTDRPHLSGWFETSYFFYAWNLALNLSFELAGWAVLYFYGNGWAPWVAAVLLITVSQAQLGWLQVRHRLAAPPAAET